MRKRVLNFLWIAASVTTHSLRSLTTSANSAGAEQGSSSSLLQPIIYRKEIAEGGNVRSFALSTDISQKQFTDFFNDFEGKRCRLCGESYLQWHSHCGANIPHTAREAIALEMVRAFCGTPEQIVQMWWHRLHTSPKFLRLPQLSHDNAYKRKRRLLYILTFLRDKKVLRECFNVTQGQNPATKDTGMITSAGRSWEFERLEWVGDNVVKYIFNDRINVLFPYSEGGIRGRLGYAQFMIDGNDGLARAYDYLEFQKLTNSDRVVSKFKSDVVECMFGELQVYLWSTERDWGTEYVESPFTPEMIPLRALVRHAMEEAAHCMLMYHLDYILANVKKMIHDNNVVLVRADPALQGNPALRKEIASRRYGKGSAGHHGGSHALDGSRYLTPSKVTIDPRLSRELYQRSQNYQGFHKVWPLGGLLPRPFHVAELTPSPQYLPHLQVQPKSIDPTLREDNLLSPPLDKSLHEAVPIASAPHSCSKPSALSSSSSSSEEGSSVSSPRRWNLALLKDQQLIPQLT